MYRAHVLICGGTACTVSNSQSVYEKMVEEIKKAGLQDEIQIVKTKRFAMKPMDPEEACIQMELLGHNFFMFLNADTNEVNVVYKRKSNSYGLIEPEF